MILCHVPDSSDPHRRARSMRHARSQYTILTLTEDLNPLTRTQSRGSFHPKTLLRRLALHRVFATRTSICRVDKRGVVVTRVVTAIPTIVIKSYKDIVFTWLVRLRSCARIRVTSGIGKTIQRFDDRRPGGFYIHVMDRVKLPNPPYSEARSVLFLTCLVYEDNASAVIDLK